MATFEKYKTKKGEFFRFKIYLGIDKVTGKRVETTRQGFKTKREAQIELNRLIREFNSGSYHRKDTLIPRTFNELFYLWFDEYSRTVKPRTKEYREYVYVKHFKKQIGDFRITKITPALLQSLINDLSKKYKQFDGLMTSVKLPLLYAYRLEFIKENPFDKVIYPKRLKDGAISRIKSSDNYLTKSELNQFFALLAKEPHSELKYSLYWLLAYSGMRLGEALALQWKDIDFNENSILINKTLTRGSITQINLVSKTPKTESAIRTVYMDSQSMDVLRKWRFNQNKALAAFGHLSFSEDQFIFTNLESNKLISVSGPSKWLATLLHKFGMKKITPHGFRHTHATLLFEAGATVKEVQTRLGHANSKTTLDIYTHVTEKRKAETANKFLNFMSN